MNKEAEYLFQHKLAKPSTSSWSSPMLLETLWFITDFCKVNAITIPDFYPLPRAEDCVDDLGRCQRVRSTPKLWEGTILTMPNLSKPFKLEVDASVIGAGAVHQLRYSTKDLLCCLHSSTLRFKKVLGLCL